MIPSLHQLSLTQLIIAAVIIVMVLAGIQRWALQRLNADPADDMDSSGGDKDSEILGDVPVRSKVGTPRQRRLQPLRTGDEPALSSAGSMLPADSLAVAGAPAFAKSKETAGTGQPALFSAEGSPPPVFTPAKSVFESKSAESKPAEPAAKSGILPPFTPATADAAGSGTKAGPSTVLPPLSVNLPPLSTTAPAATGKSDAAPVVEKVADGIVAIGQPVPLASNPAEPQAAPAETDDVKKRKSSSVNAGAKPQSDAGMILTPKAGDAVAEIVPGAPVTPPVPPVELGKAAEIAAPSQPEAKPESSSKSGARPRIFLPANLAATTPTPAAPVEATPAKSEITSGPGPEAKSEVPPVPMPEAKPVPPVATPSEPVAAKPATPAPPSAEPAKPEAHTAGGWLRGILRRSDAEEPAKPEAPAPTAKVEEAKPAAPAKAPEPVAPAVEAKPAVAPAAVTPPDAPATEKKIFLAPAAPAAESKPAPIPPVAPVPVAATPEVSVKTPQPTMAQNESTTNVPANSRASAQLTLGFEIASLQLTPFFKLGAVQLKPLSKVVGLHLIASQSADAPLAAGISFEIEKVELNEASHVRSITLKPLGDAQAAAVPQSKLSVDTIQLGQGSEDAPISVTSSGSAPAAVQLLATFSIAAMDFTPAFEIGSLRLEPTSNSVLLRTAASAQPASLDLPPSFEVASVSLGEDGQISGMRLTPGSKPS